MRGVTRLAAVVATLVPLAARGTTLDDLDLGADWQLRTLRFEGNRALGARELRRAMLTRPRPWYAPWRRRPAFDPVAFRTDLERLRRLYESRGYYHARITYDLELPRRGRALAVLVSIAEGPPVRIDHVDVALAGAPLAAEERRRLLEELPIAAGEIFTEERYDGGFARLRAYYREHGFARVRVTRAATVDLARDAATVTYDADSGPASVFGMVHVHGAPAVGEEVVRREIAFRSGEPFRESLLDRSRQNLAALGLFRTIRVEEEPGEAAIVDIAVRVEAAPPREVRLGVGYDTEEGVRGLAGWRHYNFLGGARQLGVSARLSQIQQGIAADFLQPHFPGPRNRTRLLFLQARDDEDTYTLDRTSLSPRIEWQATPRVTGFVFHRLEYDSLGDVNAAVKARLPGAAPANAVLSGLGLGVVLNTTDDTLDPSRGVVTALTVEPVGTFLGGDIDFIRTVAEGRIYQPLVARLIAAGRFRLGFSEPLDGTPEVPLYERFYAGGSNSVRGYGRRRVGPLVDDDPIGGRTLVETSVELRHPITTSVGGALFADAGQVGLENFDFRFDDLRYGAGVGVYYKSPVGALRVDLAFPTDPPAGDQHWQVYLSLGATF